MSDHIGFETLNDHVDGVLPAAEAARVAGHLRTCGSCRAEADALRALVGDVGRLPSSIEPGRDLLSGIRSRIEASAGRIEGARQADVVPAAGPEAVRPGRRAGRGIAFAGARSLLVAAAVLLVVSTAAITRWWVLRDGSGPGPVAEAPARAPASFVDFRATERRVVDEIDDVERTLRIERENLAPGTIEILERNLEIIDRAIAESRAALETDPANAELGRMVLSAYDQKLELLRRARESKI